MAQTILVIGSSGQIGTELVLKLRQIYGNENVIASDIRVANYEVMKSGSFEILDATKKKDILKVIKKHKVKQVYLMAAMLSAIAEKHPHKAWSLNMTTLFNVLDLAKEKAIKQVFWPSSIAVFGPSSPKQNTPQETIMAPTTVYGISKVAGENWCAYYHDKYGVDVRSVRYPGIISYKTVPGGGTTDYAVEIFYAALQKKNYQCFLKADTQLDMMYMPDAVNAAISLMQTDVEQLTHRNAFNVTAMSITPEQLAAEIKKHIPDFTITYKIDPVRQAIADSWPKHMDDNCANQEWGWQPEYTLSMMVKDMLEKLALKFSAQHVPFYPLHS